MRPYLLLLTAFLILSTSVFADTVNPATKLRNQCISNLYAALDKGNDWERVHAAEALIRVGEAKSVIARFAPQADKAGPKYRIGVWRVLAQAYRNDLGKQSKYLKRIISAFNNTNGPDRLHAVETLGKLGYSAQTKYIIKAANDNSSPLRVNSLWVLANSGRAKYIQMLADCLESPDATVRSEAAYALRFLPKVNADVLESLKSAADRENISTGVGVYIVSAFCVQASRQGKGSEAKTAIKTYATGNNDEKYELCACLASIGNKSDIPLLKRLLRDKSLDVRTSAANAILSITSRK